MPVRSTKFFKLNNKYNIQTYFRKHNYLKISSIAKVAGLNPGLVRQYVSGIKQPSEIQIKKIQMAINKIIEELKKDLIC